MVSEYQHLSECIQKMWDSKTNFFYDTNRNHQVTQVMTVGSYWVLLAEIATKEQAKKMVEHLFDPHDFYSKMVVPGLAQNHLNCDDIYWRGGVWAPTTYMVFKGLEKYGFHKERHLLARRYLDAILLDFKETQSLYEVYESKTGKHQSIARPHFVGWTGLAPISVLIEDILGIRFDAVRKTLTIHVFETIPYQLNQLLFGEYSISIEYHPDLSLPVEQLYTIQSNLPIKIELISHL